MAICDLFGGLRLRLTSASTSRALLLGTIGLAASLSAGCGKDGRTPTPAGLDGLDWNSNLAPLPDAGTYAGKDQSCDDEGAQVECGKVVEQHGDYVTCSMGYRTCTDGRWSACIGTRRTQKATPQPITPGLHTLALGSAGTCPAGFDTCDPYCNQIADTPGSFAAGPTISNTPAGVTPLPTGVGNCTSLTLTPSTNTLTVTSLSPLTVTGNPVTFTLTAAPSGCTTTPFATTWTVDKLDRATMSGGTALSNGGKLQLAVPVAGNLKVTAFAQGTNVSANIAVKVNVVAAPTTSAEAIALGTTPPNGFTSVSNIGLFSSSGVALAGTAPTTVNWLYPYGTTPVTCASCPPTYFPLGLPAPMVQYDYTSGFGKAVKVSLRYPAGSTVASSTFNYSLIVKESNVASQAAGVGANTDDAQIVIPQSAWTYFEQTARGANADIVVQRLQGTLEVESPRTIHFVDGQLKGTVYYNSYTSPQGGNTGAVLSIAPGATSPTLAVQPSGKCTVCHSLNLDGSTLIANGGRSSNAYLFNQSRRYDMTHVTSTATPATLTDYNDSVIGDFVPGDYDAVGDRFTFGAPWVDGSVYLTHGGDSSNGGDNNWRAPNALSKFFRPATATATGSAAISVTGWGNVSGITPRFSPSGNRVAFGFWGPTGATLPCSSNAIAPCTTSGSRTLAPVASTSGVGGGTRLVVMDFTSPSNPASSTGWAVTNARDVTPGIAQKVAWPSFTPDGNSVIYQRQYRTSKSSSGGNGGVLSGGWSSSDINTVGGALAELWMSNIPADGSSAATPTRLANLNGIYSGSSYLPKYAQSNYVVTRFDTVQTTTSGTAGPAVVLSGTPTDSPWDVRVDITVAGARGTAKFQYSTDGGSSWSATLTTAATVALGTTGLTATFPNTSSYNATSVYQALVGQVMVTGTPTGGPWDVRIAISVTGGLGTAKFKYSTDGGSSWSSNIATGASVSLGTTGLTALFGNVTYSSTAWTFGTTVDSYPSYHQANASFTITQADSCLNTGTASNVNDYQLNYLPAVAPTEAGNFQWVVFTSRRMYGNIATSDPWDAEPNQSCSSGEPPTKKLWVAAIDKNWTPGSDPSHPAFYLPGQELEAGNSNGYWVNQQCSALNATCTSDDDCCGGTGSSPTTRCTVVSTATVPPTKQCQPYDACSATGESCTADSDCCTGLVCPSGGGQCVSLPSPVYTAQSLDREYVASCAYGTYPAWRFFEWQASVPTGSSIDYSIQTRQLATDAYKPVIALAMASATTTTAAGTWDRGPNTAGQVLSNANQPSLAYLRVTITFNPNPAGTAAPTLLNWREVYDCLPSQ